MDNKVKIKRIRPEDIIWVRSLLEEHWGSVEIVSHGKITRADKIPGFIAYYKHKPVGLITYLITGNECEIVSLNSFQEKIGIGTLLVRTVIDQAKKLKLKRVWVITTNDNLHAQLFYQNRGFRLVKVHKNALELSRKLKPQIPLIGMNGIPLKDEIELEVKL